MFTFTSSSPEASGGPGILMAGSTPVQSAGLWAGTGLLPRVELGVPRARPPLLCASSGLPRSPRVPAPQARARRGEETTNKGTEAENSARPQSAGPGGRSGGSGEGTGVSSALDGQLGLHPAAKGSLCGTSGPRGKWGAARPRPSHSPRTGTPGAPHPPGPGRPEGWIHPRTRWALTGPSAATASAAAPAATPTLAPSVWCSRHHEEEDHGNDVHPSGLLRQRCRPGGGRTQGCEQHGPPQDEVPLGREGAQVRAEGRAAPLGLGAPAPRLLGSLPSKRTSRGPADAQPHWLPLSLALTGAAAASSSTQAPSSPAPQLPGPGPLGLLWRQSHPLLLGSQPPGHLHPEPGRPAARLAWLEEHRALLPTPLL